MRTHIRFAFALATLCGVAGAPCHAQTLPTRTWVSAVGNDANPCSRTAPCKTFAGAIDKTAASGEISVLDSGDFGPVSIAKSISIVADGVEAGIIATSGPPVVIYATPADTVFIKGLHIEGAASSTYAGVIVSQAKTVLVTDTVIRGFTRAPGVQVRGTSPISVLLKNVRINTNSIGVSVGSFSQQILLTLDSCTIFGNATSVAVDKRTSVLAATGSTIFGPASLTNGGQFVSAGNNAISGNLMPTSVVPLR